MAINNKLKLIFLLISLLLSLSGCITVQEPAQAQSPVMPVINSEQENVAVKRFQDSNHQGLTPVETAVEISEKYAKLTEQASLFREQNNQLNKQNDQLNARLDAANTKLAQTEKELKEANDMLIDMRIELNNWKVDVLGFRDEMRNADNAQLKALLKILNTLGGNVNLEDSTQANELEAEPNEPQT
jgi:septal ring factor EnvC (AmiA/AmiB activator)